MTKKDDELIYKRIVKAAPWIFPEKEKGKKNVYLARGQTRALYLQEKKPKFKEAEYISLGIDPKEIKCLFADLFGSIYPNHLVLTEISKEGPALLRITCPPDEHYLKGVWFAIAPRAK